MRLSQLARQVSRTSKELIVFLHSRGIENYSGTNAKIDPDHVRLVLDHFIPERITSSKETISAGKNDPASDPLQTADRPAKQELHSENSMDPLKNLPQSKEPEIIRAPKMKLQGVKVIGKIELPEKPLKKAEKKPDTRENIKNTERDNELKKSKRPPHSNKQKSTYHPKTANNLSYLEKQKRQERKREKEKRDRLRKEKEKKKIHYQKNVQSKIQSVPVKIKDKAKKEKNNNQNTREATPLYKNPFKRFWAWLNGAYDE